jgi:hypothetical protein
MASVPATAALPAFLDALDYARAGIDRGVRSFSQIAQAVADGIASGEEPAAASRVGALVARNQVAASARVLASDEQLVGTLLDLRA